jgi:hypothetical protein
MGTSTVPHDAVTGTGGELIFLRLHANRRMIEPGISMAVSASRPKVKGVFVIASFRFSDVTPDIHQPKANEQNLCIRPRRTQRHHPITPLVTAQPICRCRIYRLKPKKRFFFKTLGR